jgi:2-polyprenyl-3-methyl-5-hydroxy-6-metoxy-1,4-benzoquinol methylase
MELLHECPACSHKTIKFTERIKDHFLSQEDFQIFHCFSCGHLFTNPRPSPDQITAYYKSENYISHSDSDKGLINKVYRIVRKRTLNWKAAQLNSHFGRPGKLLDIGCGSGNFLARMQTDGWECFGIEPDPDARAMASRYSGITVTEESHLSEWMDETFDAITLWHVLEHVYDLHKRLAEIKRLLKPGGILILALPNPSSADALKYGSYWAAWDVPRHVHHFKPSVVHELLHSKGFRFLYSRGMVYDAYYISMLSERYLKRSLSPLRGLLHGFMSNRQAERRKEAYSSMMYLFTKD